MTESAMLMDAITAMEGSTLGRICLKSTFQCPSPLHLHGLDERKLLHRQDLAPHDPEVGGDVHYRYGYCEIDDATAQDRGYGYRQDEPGEGVEGIHKQGESAVDQSSESTRRAGRAVRRSGSRLTPRRQRPPSLWGLRLSSC